jgi:hypothetical protein
MIGYDSMKQKGLQDAISSVRSSILDKIIGYLSEAKRRFAATFLPKMYGEA